MARNPIQFQQGLSLPAFLEQYGTEEQCRQAVFQMRWPDGFICPECSHDGFCILRRHRRYQCNRCGHQTSLTVGTVFEQTKLPLRTWFLALYRLTQTKQGISALQLSRNLGVNYNTAWSMKHKLTQVMFERQQGQTLSGRVELDDAYLGGERAGIRGRGSPNKVPFVAAVATHEGRPWYLQMRRVEGFSRKALRDYARASLAEPVLVLSDGLPGLKGIAEAGRAHEPHITGSGRQAAQHPSFHWVNTMLGNIKNAIRGTYHAVAPKHVPRYLAEFEYRFNRRFDLASMVERLARAATQTAPMPFKLLKLAEPYK